MYDVLDGANNRQVHRGQHNPTVYFTMTRLSWLVGELIRACTNIQTTHVQAHAQMYVCTCRSVYGWHCGSLCTCAHPCMHACTHARTQAHTHIYNTHTHSLSYNFFSHCRFGLPAARVGTVEVMVAAYSQPAALQWASDSNEGARHKRGQTRLATQ